MVGLFYKWQGRIFFSHGTTNSCGVRTGFLGNKKIKCNKIRTDNNGRIIVLGAEIDDEIFLLVSLHNPNTEALQVKTLCELEQMLDMFSMIFLQKCFFSLETLIVFLRFG